MIEEAEALERILSTSPAASPERIPLGAAHGRVLCEEIRAEVPLPGFDQSSMDGYAIRGADLKDGLGRFRIAGELAAGAGEELHCGKGEAIRVFTGSPLPLGADTVVMQEDVNRENGFIELLEEVEAGEFVRHEGEVLCRGQKVGSAGDLLDAGRVGVLASQGIAEVSVGRLPRVAVLTTGDELVEAGGALARGQLFNSNGPMLSAAVREGGAVPVHCAHAVDDLKATEEQIRRALEVADVLLVAGGVSVGDRDFVKPALALCGIEPNFWRVRVRPGKPLLYATREDGKQIFGLPGNPVSALVCFTVFALPAICRRRGVIGDSIGAERRQVRLNTPLSNQSDRPHFMRGRIDESGGFSATGMQESHGLAGMAVANALLRVGPGVELLADSMAEALLMPG